MENLKIETPRGTFSAIAAGNPLGTLVLCVHGFADNAETYSDLLTRLSTLGFRAVSFNMRGYFPSPLEGSYNQDSLSEDFLSIADVLSPNKPIFAIGQEVGAETVYHATAKKPARFTSAISIGAPMLDVLMANSKKSIKQIWRSRYVMLMQLRGIAEWFVSRNNFAYIDQIWHSWSPNYQLSDSHLASVKPTFRKSMPGPTAMYRSGEPTFKISKISVPTLLLLGENDGRVSPEMAEGQINYFDNKFEIKTIKGVGHFLHLEKPDLVFDRIAGWIEKFNTKEIHN